MKNINKQIFLSLIVLSLLAAACGYTSTEPVNESSSGTTELLIQDITLAAYDTPTEIQTKALQYMREEEKLARDIYQAMYTRYSFRSLKNISSSEQTHMNAIKTLLNKYSIEDPVSTDIPGEFQNTELQKLYNTLIAKGNISIDEAFKVGAEIEEIDIIDLKNHTLELVNNDDIRLVYTNLKNGSLNHLRAFVNNLASHGIKYTPVYLTQDEYNSIVK